MKTGFVPKRRRLLMTRADAQRHSWDDCLRMLRLRQFFMLQL